MHFLHSGGVAYMDVGVSTCLEQDSTWAVLAQSHITTYAPFAVRSPLLPWMAGMQGMQRSDVREQFPALARAQKSLFLEAPLNNRQAQNNSY